MRIACIAALGMWAWGTLAGDLPEVKLETVQHEAARALCEPVEKKAVTFEVIVVDVPEQAIGTVGLSNLFETALPTTELMSNAIAKSPVTLLSLKHTNVFLDGTPLQFYAARCNHTEADQLLALFRQTPGVDVLTAPKVSTLVGREAVVAVENKLTILTGIAPGTNTLMTTPLMTGLNIGLWAALCGTNLQLKASAQSVRFHGYADPPKKLKVAGKPVNWPEPLVQLTVVGIRAEISTNDVLLLGTEMRQNIFETVEKWPWLGDIPLLGEEVFTKRQMQTNQVRQVYLVRPRTQ